MKKRNKMIIWTAGILTGLVAALWVVKVEDKVAVDLVTTSYSPYRGVRARKSGSIHKMIRPFGSMVEEGDTVMIFARYTGKMDTVVAPISGKVVDLNPELHVWGFRLEDEILFDVKSSVLAPRSKGHGYLSEKERRKVKEGQEVFLTGSIISKAKVKSVSDTPDSLGRYRFDITIDAWGEGIPDDNWIWGDVKVEKARLLEKLLTRIFGD